MSRTVKYLLVIFLMLLSLSERLFFDLGDNVELITLSVFVTAYYIDKKLAWILALASIAISDIFLGNTSIMFFTWSAYLMISLLAIISNTKKYQGVKKIFTASGGGIISSLWFYLWTNFGVWLLDSWDMYSNDLYGLQRSYISGLPFLRTHLVSNILILSSVFFFIESVRIILHNFRKPQFKIVALKHSGIR